MRTAYFDCTSGIAGDMFIGSLVDAGLPVKLLKQTAKLLNIDCSFSQKQTDSGLLFYVNAKENIHDNKYKAIADLIEKSKISSNVKDIALKIYEKIALAESKVHQEPLSKIHFHELGTADAIIDIVGAATGIDYFKPEEIYSSPIPSFRGSVEPAHGRIPLPAPAVLEMIKNVPIEPSPVRQEIVTPTGAGIITTIASGFGENPLHKIEISGTGRGKRDTAPLSNALRFYLGEGFKVFIIETTIDDMNPQIFGYIQKKLLDMGATEVLIQNAQGKKDRPTFVISCQIPFNLKNKAIDLLLKETTTFGVRFYPVERKILERKIETKNTKFGRINVKLGFDEKGNLLKTVPEFEDCVKIAKLKNKSILEIYTEIQKQILNKK